MKEGDTKRLKTSGEAGRSVSDNASVLDSNTNFESASEVFGKRLRSVFESSFDALFEVDASGAIREWTPGAETCFGWPAHQVLGQPASILVPERHREGFSATLRRIIEAGIQYENRDPWLVRALHRDRREFSAAITFCPYMSSAGYVLAGFVRDRSDRKRLESALGAIEDHRTILNFIEDGYIELDLQGNVLFVNDAFCRMYNRTREEVLDRNYTTVFQSAVSVDNRAVYRRVYETGEPVRAFEYEYKPGQYCENTVSLKRDSQGKPTGFITINRETTKRKKQEQLLASAKEAAEEANRVKSAFLANMSHEIRTPMNGILGMTELALSSGLNEEQEEYLNAVRTSADALLAIINDILDYSKIEAGKVELDPAPFDLQECACDALRNLAVAAHRKGLELIFQIEPDVPARVVGDSTRLRQVLLNLVGNAIKFTPKGEVALTIGVHERGSSDMRLLFSVRDTGIGIPADRQDRLFQVFQQADTSTTRKYGGTGLGLVISKRLVELMGGGIWLDSTPGQGTTFQFTTRIVPDASAAPGPLRAVDLEGLRVLIIDDNATNRRVLRQFVTQWNMRPDEADSGAAGLAVLEESLTSGDPFRLVLVDEQMPEMNGLQVVKRIRSDASFGAATIMMLTSSGQDSSIAKCREFGAAGCLTKPLRPAELQMAIRKALGLPGAQLPARSAALNFTA